MKLYGLKTCDSCRKALSALEAAGRDVEFADIRDTPLPAALLDRLVAEYGETVVNRRSKTWAALGEEERALPPAVLLARHPVAMKRPVIEAGGRLYLGWTEAVRTVLTS